MSSPIGFFSPFPNPTMVPFMAFQSLVQAQAFGLGFQYGKRKISSMTNEEFNKLTPQMLDQEITADIRSMIPSLQQSMADMTPMMKTIIEQMGAMINELIKALPQTVNNIIGLPAPLDGSAGAFTKTSTPQQDLQALIDGIIQWSHADTGTTTTSSGLVDVNASADTFKNYSIEQLSLALQDLRNRNQINTPLYIELNKEYARKLAEKRASGNILQPTITPNVPVPVVQATPEDIEYNKWKSQQVQLLQTILAFRKALAKIANVRVRDLAGQQRIDEQRKQFQSQIDNAIDAYKNFLQQSRNIRNSQIITAVANARSQKI